MDKQERIEKIELYGKGHDLLIDMLKDIPQEMISGEIERIANNYVKYADWFR